MIRLRQLQFTTQRVRLMRRRLRHMKKFRILGVIAIIAIIANFFGGLDENWRDFKKGFEDGHNSAMGFYPVDPVSGDYVFGAPQFLQGERPLSL